MSDFFDVLDDIEGRVLPSGNVVRVLGAHTIKESGALGLMVLLEGNQMVTLRVHPGLPLEAIACEYIPTPRGGTSTS
jgi:hypothetical protein